MHESLEKSISAFHELEKTSSLARKRYGDHVSEGTLAPTLGRRTIARPNGHFDFFEYVGSSAAEVFSVHSMIPKAP